MLKSVRTATVPFNDVAPMESISLASFAMATEVNENAGNKALGIFEFPSNPGIPLGILIALLSTLSFNALDVK